MTNNTSTPREIRDALYTLLQWQTGTGKKLAWVSKFHPVGPGKYPYGSVEPGLVTNPELLTNVEVLRPYGFDILIQYQVPTSEVDGIDATEYAWNKAMDAVVDVMDALDTATNLGLAWVKQVTPAKPVPGKALIGWSLTVYYIIEVAVWTVFDKI